MARKSKIEKHGSVISPTCATMSPPPRPPAEEEYRVGPGRPPKEYRWKPGQSGNPKGAKRKKRSLIPELKEEFERVFSQKLKVTQGDRQRLISRWVAGLEQLSIQFAKGDRHARRDVFYFAEKLGVDLLTSTKSSDDTLSADHQAILEAYVERRMQEKATSASAPVLAPPSCSMTRQTKPTKTKKTKGEDHDDDDRSGCKPRTRPASAACKGSDGVYRIRLQRRAARSPIEAELAPGRGHLQAIPSSKGLHPTFDHHAAPALAQVSMRIGGSAGLVSRPLSLGARGRGLVFRFSFAPPRERLPPRGQSSFVSGDLPRHAARS